MPAKRPAILLGARAAVATITPVVLGIALDWPGARWATIAGFSAAVIDKGGAYRTRAWAMLSVTVGSSIAILIAAHAGSPWTSAAAMLFVATFGGLLRVLGPEMASVGTSSAVMLAIALEVQIAPSDTWSSFASVLAGGAWAMTLSLIFWPIRVHRPSRRAVANLYRELEAHVQAMATELEHGSEASWRAMIQRDHRAIRERLEEARAVLAATRRGNRGESGRGARLLALFSIADQSFAVLVALGDAIEETKGAVRTSALAKLRQIADSIRPITASIESEDKTDAPRVTKSNEVETDETLAILARVRWWLVMASDVAATLHDDAPLPHWENEEAPPPFENPDSAFSGFRSALSFDSAIARHAARLGITAAIAEMLARALHLQRAYWVTLTVIVVLQPYTPETMKKGAQRIGGTIAGGALAALLVFTFRNPNTELIAAAVLAAASVSVLQVNYALYAFFLTPAFILLAEHGGGDYHLVGLRILNTLMGGALAIAGARLFWPARERGRFPVEMARALRELRVLFEASIEPKPDATKLANARRAAGIAINNADASFQRLLAEAGTAPVDMEPRMTLLLFARRFAGSCLRASAMGNVGHDPEFAKAAEDLLASVANAIEKGTAPPPLPSASQMRAKIPALERVGLQLRVLHDAALRLVNQKTAISAEAAPSTSG